MTRNLQTFKSVFYNLNYSADRQLNLKKSETHAISDPKEKTAYKNIRKLLLAVEINK